MMLDMNRRDFLKGVVAVSAAGAVMMSPTAVAFTGQSAPETTAILTGGSDIVIENTEIMYRESMSGYLYRGLAHVRRDPYNRKYFSFFVDDSDVVDSKEFKKDLYVALRQAFGVDRVRAV